MALVQKIDQDLLESLRSKNTDRTAILRLIKNSLKNFAIDKRVPETELSDEQVLSVLRQESKKRRESITAFTQGNRPDLADHEQQELEAIEAYLPAAMSSQEIQAIIETVIQEQGLPKPYQFGALMGQVVKKVAGRADGQAVKKEVEEYIARS